MGVKDAWRALFQKSQVSTTQRPMRGEIGYTGNKIFAGLPMDEYNPDLAFPESTYKYDEMRRSDGQIAAIMNAVKLPIRSAKWYVEPDKDAKDEKLAEQIAEFVEDNLMHGMRYSWDDHLREALLMLDFGFSVFEKVFRFDTWQGKSVVMLDKYAPRIAPSIWRFPQDEKTGDIIAVEQINVYTGQMFTIPLNKCRIYTYQREGDNPVGISMLRPIYKHWYYKDMLYKLMAVGTEKSLIGTPYATMPRGASQQDTTQTLAVLSAIRAAEEAGFTVPEGVVLGMLEGTKSAMDPMPLLEHHDTMISRSVLGQFINLGTMATASGGSYALGQTMSAMFTMGLGAIADYLQEEIQSDIEQLVEWNFGPDAPMPQLRHGTISIESFAERMTAIGALGAGHLINTDEELENYLRQQMGVPPISQAALDNQLLLPANRYVPEIIPDKKLSAQMAADAAKAQAQAKAPGMVQGAQPIKANEGAAGFGFADDDTAGGTPPASAGDKVAQTWKRPLQGLEDAASIAALDAAWQRLEQRWIDRLGAQRKKAARDLVDQVKQIVTSTIDRVTMMHSLRHLKVSTAIQQDYTATVEQLMRDAYEAGSKSSAKELKGEAKPLTDNPEAEASIHAKAELITTDQLRELEQNVQFEALGQVERNVAAAEVVKAVRESAATQVEARDLKLSAMVSVGEALNIGRGATAREVGVQGAQWSAVLDDHTCPLCAELDGQTISVDNPDFDVFRPPLHFGCRCFLIYVGTGQTNFEPDWKTPDPALVKMYGGLVR